VQDISYAIAPPNLRQIRQLVYLAQIGKLFYLFELYKCFDLDALHPTPALQYGYYIIKSAYSLLSLPGNKG
jgi:hypothetical protein